MHVCVCHLATPLQQCPGCACIQRPFAMPGGLERAQLLEERETGLHIAAAHCPQQTYQAVTTQNSSCNIFATQGFSSQMRNNIAQRSRPKQANISS
jgi:hypothetical protein